VWYKISDSNIIYHYITTRKDASMLQEILVDDTDHEVTSLTDETVAEREFAIDGTAYVIHLSDENYAEMCAELADYIKAARTVGGKRGPGRKATAVSAPAASDKPVSMDREQSKAIRDWARRNGYPMSERGRIPVEVTRAYNAKSGGDVSALKNLIDAKAGITAPVFSSEPQPANV
jgi:hypothetical protein